MRDLFKTILALSATLFAITGPADASTVDSYAYGISVQSATPTSGPTPNITATGIGGLITVPMQSSGITTGQDLHTASGALGQVAASSAASGSGNGTWGLWTESGTSAGTGDYGVLSVSAVGTATGNGDGNTLTGSEAFGRFDDRLTFTNGSGSGIAHLTLSVTGHALINDNYGRGAGELAMFYWEAGSSIANEAFRLSQNGSGWNVRNEGSWLVQNGRNVATLPSTLTPSAYGYTLSSFLTHIDLPFTYGVPVEFKALLFASEIANGYGGPNTADFFATTALTGIAVSNNNNPTITSGSETLYDNSGAHPVPEPASLVLLGIGAASLLAYAWRRRTRTP